MRRVSDFCLQLICVRILLYGRERKKTEMLIVYFADRSRRGRKKIMEKKEGKEKGSRRERQGWLCSDLDPR